MKRIQLYSPLVLFITLLSACKKFTDVPPPSYLLSSQQVFASDSLATAAVTGIYSEMMRLPNQFSAAATTLYTGLYSDEFITFTGNEYAEFMAGKLSSSSHPLLSSIFWGPAYKYIYTANVCIENLTRSAALSPPLKNTLLGEAKFIRAFCYFYLVNLFGDVPLVSGSDFRVNAMLPRAATGDVYQQIKTDLSEAIQQLPELYPDGKRTRPTKGAAAALLARVFLYTQQWPEAIAEATAVINQPWYTLEPDLNRVFMRTAPEAIWQLQPVNSIVNTWEGNLFLSPAPSVQPSFRLTDNLMNAFEQGDRRKQAWVQSVSYLGQRIYFPYKYKVYGNNAPVSEYYTVLRLAEQYLIRAEANAQLGNRNDALQDVNTIRKRAGLNEIAATDPVDLLAAIEKERQIELAFEWGHRWFDLKRNIKVDSIMQVQKGPSWHSWQVNWPVPSDQLSLNLNLHQNPGY